jgi:exosortase/archaeosortase
MNIDTILLIFWSIFILYFGMCVEHYFFILKKYNSFIDKLFYGDKNERRNF